MICDYCGKELDYQRTEVGTEFAACENPDCPSAVELDQFDETEVAA